MSTIEVSKPGEAELLTKLVLHDLAVTYCRGVDRLDEALLASVWHDDATVDAGVFRGGATEFCTAINAYNAGLEHTYHMISNEWYDVRGDMALGECYTICFSTIVESGVETDRITGGRYLDRFECRNGIWKIAHKTYVHDWNMNQSGSSIWDKGMYAQFTTRGRRCEQDPAYAFFNSQIEL